MARTQILCVLFSLFLINTFDGGYADSGKKSPEPRVDTALGSIMGSWMETRRGRRFHAYRGIRYAQPPVGELRFQPPVPVSRYNGTVDARNEGPGCPQPVEDQTFFMDEDCLRLNVYTPRTRGPPMPVIVFLHAGGFYSLSGRSDVAGPHYLMDRDVVLVTVNYRLGTLGFMSTGDEHAPGNYGFKDQVEALRWVRRHIRSFGGDAARVTLAGYSAGSLSVGLLMLSPMAKGLFHRAISMSASPLSQVQIPKHQLYLAEKQARLVGCPTATTKVMVDCLRNKPVKEIADSLNDMFEFNFDPILMWTVVLEPKIEGREQFLVEQPLDTITEGRAHSVPYIIGQTTDEFFWKAFTVAANSTLFHMMNSNWEHFASVAFLLPRDGADATSSKLREAYFERDDIISNDTNELAALGKLYSDSVIGFAVHRMANLMCRHSTEPVYHYEFAYIGTHSHYQDPNTGKPLGAAHHDDLIYVFSLDAVFPRIALNSTDNVIVDRLTAIWYNFARYGVPDAREDTPELGSLKWSPLTVAAGHYLRIGDQFSTHQNLFQQRYNTWDKLYPIQY